MDGTMRERLARVLCSRATGDDSEYHYRAWFADADAVLDAMRSPDEAMIEAGSVVNLRTVRAAGSIWTAMIDAARTPAKES